MTIGTKIIKRALRKIQVDTLNSPASPGDIEGAVPVLNEMLALWTSKNIELGILPLESAGNELGEPPDAALAIVANLALYLADDYEDGQAIVTTTLKDNARRTFEDLASLGYRTLNIPGKVPSPTLLTGEGNKAWWNSFQTFFGPNTTLGGSEGFDGFRTGTGAGGGIPGPPGPPGPQGPPGPEVFATLAETIAGVIDDKSIAPDTAHGLLGSPPNIGTVLSPTIIQGGGIRMEDVGGAVATIASLGTRDLQISSPSGGIEISTTGVNKAIGLQSSPGGFVEINNVEWPEQTPITYTVGHIPQISSVAPSNIATIAWELPHEILGLLNNGDMVYNNASDVLTRLPIGAEGQVMKARSSIPAWVDEPTGAHKNYIIDGDFSETFETGVSSPVDGNYITPLIRYKNTSTATHLITRETVDIPTIDESGHKSHAALKIAVSVADAAVANGDSTQIIYHITGSDYVPLPEKQITYSTWIKAPIGTYGIGFRNETGSRSYPTVFTIVSADTWTQVFVTLTADVITGWKFALEAVEQGELVVEQVRLVWVTVPLEPEHPNHLGPVELLEPVALLLQGKGSQVDQPAHQLGLVDLLRSGLAIGVKQVCLHRHLFSDQR